MTSQLIPASLGVQGPGETQMRSGRFFRISSRVVAMHLHFRAQFSEVLDEVVGERIVVVDDQQHPSH